MKLNVLQIILALGIFTTSCKTQQFLPTEFKDKQINFGSGGGFTGGVNQYILFENGQLFTQKGMSDSLIVLPKIKRKQIKLIFEKYEEYKIGEKFIHFPGNRYHFIEMKEDQAISRQTWGKNDYTPDKQLLEFYNLLNSVIKKDLE